MRRRRRVGPLEASIEQAFVDRVEYCGAVTRKLNGLGYNSWPDRWVLPGPPRRNLDYAIEFKRPGEEPTPLQARLHRQLRERGLDTFVFDSWQMAFEHFVERAQINLAPVEHATFMKKVKEVRDGSWRSKGKRRAAR